IAIAASTACTLPPVGGEGRPRSPRDRGRGGGTTLAPTLWGTNIACSAQAAPPTPDPSPPLAEPVLGLAEGKTRGLAGGGEKNEAKARSAVPTRERVVQWCARFALRTLRRHEKDGPTYFAFGRYSSVTSDLISGSCGSMPISTKERDSTASAAG